MQIRQINPSSLKNHPLAHLVPDMRHGEWQDFYRDIAARGIKVPLEVLGDGTVIDGRHRLRAAIELGMKEVPIIDAPLNGDEPDVYMLKAAVLRRHLTDSQRAIIAALWKEENKTQPEIKGRDEKGRILPTAGRSDEGYDEHPTRSEATNLFNVSRWRVDQASYVQSHAPELAQKVHKGEIALSNAYRQAKAPEERRKIEATRPPVGIFQVIVIDPPWPYSSRQQDPTHNIASPYQMMTVDDIKQLSIPCAQDSIIWLWTTNAFLHDAFHALESWGFTYRTMLTWAKRGLGLGDWLGGQTEHCLLGTKGNYRVFRKSEGTLLDTPQTKHSEKPDAFYQMVESLCPGNRIDMFARKERDGWECWGAEVNEKARLEEPL